MTPIPEPLQPDTEVQAAHLTSRPSEINKTALPRWIPVSDGFPHVGHPVLVTYTGASGCACYAWMDSEIEGPLYWEIVSPDDGSIWRSDGDDQDSVTHWAEVPANAHGASWSAAASEAVSGSAKTALSVENLWLGDMMILQVLADSDNVNEQEREVLARWLASSPLPQGESAGSASPNDGNPAVGSPVSAVPLSTAMEVLTELVRLKDLPHRFTRDRPADGQSYEAFQEECREIRLDRGQRDTQEDAVWDRAKALVSAQEGATR